MNHQQRFDQWFGQFAHQMIREGIPAAYVRRCCLELSQHVEDECSNGREFDGDLLGSCDDLAANFVEVYRAAAWYRQVPGWCWSLLAMPLAVAATLGFYSGAAVAFGLIEPQFPHFATGPTAEWLVLFLYFAGKIVSPMVAAFLSALFLGRIGQPTWCQWIASIALSLSFLFVLTDLEMSSMEDIDLSITISGHGLRHLGTGAWQLIQALTVLVVAYWTAVK